MKRYPSITILLMIATFQTLAATRIAVLDFELNDITLLPNTKEELERTASIAPLLRESLSRTGNYQAVAVTAESQRSANAGFGYLFRFHDIAANLGQQYDADWIVVSQHSKPSFLYSYLRSYLIQVKTRTTIARYDIELKGSHESVMRQGVGALANKLHQTLSRQDEINLE